MFAVAHWMLVKFLYVTNPKMDFNNWESILLFMLAIFDLPAILAAAILWSPAYIFNKEEMFYYGTIYTTILTSTFQWLLIGKIVFNFFSPVEVEMPKLSLKDE